MRLRIGKEPDPPAIAPTPKKLTTSEILRGQLLDVEAIIAAKQDERDRLKEDILWLEFTPHAEEKMRAIWDRIKPRT